MVRPGRHRGERRQGREATARPTGKSSLAHQLTSPSASSDPEAEAERPRPATPSSAASRSTEPVTDHRPAPQRAQHPDLPDALEDGHVERVEDQEAADEQRHRGEEVEDHVEGLELRLDVVALLRRASRPGRPARARARRRAWTPEIVSSPPATTTSTSSRPRGLSITRRAGAERHRREALAAEVEPGRELEEPDDLEAARPRGRREPARGRRRRSRWRRPSSPGDRSRARCARPRGRRPSRRVGEVGGRRCSSPRDVQLLRTGVGSRPLPEPSTQREDR